MTLIQTICEMIYALQTRIYENIAKALNYPSIKHKLKVGVPKGPFLLAITPKYREKHYTFLGIAPLYPWYEPNNAEC